jgi:hypothetical protein
MKANTLIYYTFGTGTQLSRKSKLLAQNMKTHSHTHALKNENLDSERELFILYVQCVNYSSSQAPFVSVLIYGDSNF